MAKPDAVKLLSGVPLFQDLSKKELQALARAAKEVRHDEGDVLAREGDSGVGFFLIVDGTAKVSQKGRTRRRLGAGDYFGEIALLDEGPRTATVMAESPITMLGLTAWVFKGLVEQHPALATKLLRTMAERLRTSAPDPTH